METPSPVIARLATSLGRRDEIPNQALAQDIVYSEDHQAIQELVAHLRTAPKAIQHDCIKVLYEVGARKPALVATYVQEFLLLLHHRDNRLQWGAMAALDAITGEVPQAIHDALPVIVAAADQGSIITRDHAVQALVQLCMLPQYAHTAFPLLLGQLHRSPTNQLPMYAEKSLPAIHPENQAQFVQTLMERLPDLLQPTKRKRVEAVIRKATKLR